MRRRHEAMRSAAALLAMAAVGLAVPHIGLADSVPILSISLTILVFTYAWNPVAGVLGEMSLVHIASWGIGAYLMVFGTNAGWSAILILALSVVGGAAIALIFVGFATAARLDGLYIAVFSLLVVELAIALVYASDFLGRVDGKTMTSLPLEPNAVYSILVVYAAVLIFLNYLLLRSRRGVGWLAIRDDALAASSLGWSPVKERALAYAGTGGLCGIGGALGATILGLAAPGQSLDLNLAIVALLAIYIGGPGTVWGPLFGAALLQGLSIAASGQSSAEATLWTQLAQYLVALVLVTILFDRQHGIRRALARVQSGLTQHAPSRISDRFTRGGRITVEPAVLPEDEPLSMVAQAGTNASSGFGVQHVRKSFGGVHVLRDVSFSVAAGEILGLVGPNGAGKSTICNIVAGTVSQDEGSVMLGGDSADGTPPHRRAQAGLGRTFQTPRVFDQLTLSQNLVVAGATDPRALLARFGVLDADRAAGAATLMERRMVEVARLAAQRPRWVLLDEPLAGLDTDEQQQVLDLVRALADAGAAVIIIEHLLPVIAPVIDRLIVLDGGVLIADGPPGEVVQDQRVIDAYLGQPVELPAPTGGTQ